MIKEFQGKYRFLSNFWSCDIYYEQIMYRSTEHAFQASKTDEQNWRMIISQLSTPERARNIGKSLPLRKDWEDMKLKIMKDINIIKFKDRILREKLLETEYQELQEGNRWGDTFWGVCGGKGENNLGKILMKIREEIRRGIVS